MFGSLEASVDAGSVTDLAAPLQAEAIAPRLAFRSLGLYAAKSRVPFTDTPALRQALDRNLRTLARAIGDAQSVASTPGLSEWGSIGTTAWVAYLELLYRDYFDLGNADAVTWNTAGIRLVEELLANGRLPSGTGFRRTAREDELRLWPNALAIHALVKAYENAELVKYESAAIDAAAALEALRSPQGSYYTTAARTESDPRANAYLAGAFLLLFKDTGDTQYLDRALGIVRWLIGPASAAADAALSAHVAYVLLLADSLAVPGAERILGRRPMQNDDGAVPPSAVDAMAARLRPADFRYRAMFDGILHTLVAHEPASAGDFAYDYGDAPGYAATVLLEAGDRHLAPQIVQREAALLAWPRPRDFDEISFGAEALLGALDHPDVAGAAAAATALHRYLALSSGLAVLDRYYFDWLDWLTNGGGFEYGPTVLGAQIAATQLRYAAHFPGRAILAAIQPLAIGMRLLDGADGAAWDAAHQIYRARPNNDEIWVLPNAMMILDLVAAQQLTGDSRYLTRAQQVATGLEAVWDARRGAYFASSGQMGEGAYESFSTNSYAALAFLRLAGATPSALYRERALRVFDFIARDLYANGIAYHHVFRGRRAAGDIWCPGCNWRVLAALMELAGSPHSSARAFSGRGRTRARG